MEEEFDPFPFNMSDFVTVDEVGEETDFPNSQSTTVPMETTAEDTPKCVQKDEDVVLFFYEITQNPYWNCYWNDI